LLARSPKGHSEEIQSPLHRDQRFLKLVRAGGSILLGRATKKATIENFLALNGYSAERIQSSLLY
jgi:hypothetical protein